MSDERSGGSVGTFTFSDDGEGVGVGDPENDTLVAHGTVGGTGSEAARSSPFVDSAGDTFRAPPAGTSYPTTDEGEVLTTDDDEPLYVEDEPDEDIGGPRGRTR